MNGFVKFLLILVILTTLGNLVNQVILWAPPVVDSETAGGSGSGSENKPGNDNENKPEEEVQKPIADVQISATVTPDENGQVPAGGVSINGVTASATVPEGVQMEEGATELTLTVNGKEDSEADLDLNENEVSTSLDVHMAGVSADNTTPIEVKLFAAMTKGLNSTSVKLYHVENGETVEMTRVANDEEFTEHNQFKYDPATGDVTLYIAGFSEIALVSNEENAWKGEFDYTWYDADETELTIANAEQLAAFGAIVGGMAKKDGQGKIYTSTGLDETVTVIQDSFSGKAVKLLADVNLGDAEDSNNPDIIFYPVGYWNNEEDYERKPLEERTTAVSSGFYTFEGTFDGNGHTIENFYQNTWEMKGDHNWYDTTKEQYFRDGMGLFGRLYKATVKNLTVKNFKSDGEITTTGVIAAYADGATFENIAIFNCNPRVYNIGNGGIVGCVGWYAKEADLKTTFTNITVDNSNKISALWGSYDVACGGIVGQYYPTSGQTSAGTPKNAGIEFTNCHVSAIMDVYNDVCANYQYYAYRYTGMLIGSVRENVTENGHSYPNMNGITAEDCTVHYGDWNDYYYCEIVANTTASYTHDHQMSRLTQVQSVDVANKQIVTLEGKTVDISTSGWAHYVVVKAKDANGKWIHGDGANYATCYHFQNGEVWNHEDAGYHDGNNGEKFIDENGDGKADLKEDKQLIYREFNNLVTGYGWGVTSKGVGDLAGVTILDRENADSHNKFDYIGENSIQNEFTFTLGDLFKAATILDSKLQIKSENVQVNVSPVNGSSVSATYDANTTDWTQGTITFSGEGAATITITDYYFCLATSVDITITAREDAKKFDLVFKNTEKYLYRVGKSGAFEISKLFAAIDGADIQNDKVEVSITAVNETGASGIYTTSATSWTKGSIQFSGTGVVKVTITDNHYCTPTELYLEVVDAVNATGATSATANNVVLLNDCTFSTITVSGGYTLYGNGFTMTCGNDSAAKDRGYGFVTLNNGTLDNVQIIAPNYSHSILYESNKTQDNNPTDGDGRYYNIKSTVIASGNSRIVNSYISGGRAAVYATNGNIVIDNSTIYGGAAANIHIGSVNSMTLKDVTLIQVPTKANVNDTSKTVMGFSIVTICDADGNTPTITLEGDFIQYAWAHAGYTDYIPNAGSSALAGFDVVSYILNNRTDYVHSITYPDGTVADSVNLGICYLPDEKGPSSPTVNDNRTNQTVARYSLTNVQTAFIYSLDKSATIDSSITTYPNVYTPIEQGAVMPEIVYEDTNENRVFGKEYSVSENKWEYSLTIDLDKGAYTFDFTKFKVLKSGVELEYTVDELTSLGQIVVEAGTVTYTIQITDDVFFDTEGNPSSNRTEKYTYIFKLIGNETSKEAPQWSSDSNGSSLSTSMNATFEAGICVASSYGGTWSGAAPALANVYVRYYSTDAKAYKVINLADYTPEGSGTFDGTDTAVTINGSDFTLTLTGGQVHSSNKINAMPVLVNGKLYFVASSSSGLVNSGNSARSVPVSYSFTDGFGNTLTGSNSWSVAENKDEEYSYSDFCNGTLTQLTNTCVTSDTLVTLADGTQKRVDELTYDDELLVWDFYEGKVSTAPISIIYAHEEQIYSVLHLNFSDGSTVKVISSHGFFDTSANNFVYISENNVTDFIGHSFVKVNGDTYNEVTLESFEVVEELTTAYWVQTAVHNNAITEGLLSITTPDYDGWFDYFNINDDMKYDEAHMQAEIEKYGLFTYEDLAQYGTYEQFVALNGQYMKILIGRGVVTMEEIIELLSNYA